MGRCHLGDNMHQFFLALPVSKRRLRTVTEAPAMIVYTLVGGLSVTIA